MVNVIMINVGIGSRQIFGLNTYCSSTWSEVMILRKEKTLCFFVFA